MLARYPDSAYAADAKARMVQLRNLLARHEINVANYYFKRGAYVAATNRGPKHWVYASFNDGAARLAPVGSYEPNDFGLHDTTGNVVEWCGDYYVPYDDEPRLYKESRDRVVLRGGAWNFQVELTRNSYRARARPDSGGSGIGVRPACAMR